MTNKKNFQKPNTPGPTKIEIGINPNAITTNEDGIDIRIELASIHRALLRGFSFFLFFSFLSFFLFFFFLF